ncbi:hypothetical protein BSKO_05796 [Bryopsis sp. KO-2023]|nr:hypothetical protein BSKO_05796 [Bryopsis sp. KO-2023]
MAEKGVAERTTGPTRRFRLLQGSTVGLDSYGTVVSAIDKVTGKYVTIKLLPKATSRGEHKRRELMNHKTLHHPHILSCKEAFVYMNRLCVVMEYCGGGTLYSKVKSSECIHEPLARWYFQQIILAVDFAHRMNTVHGNIKLENILLDETSHVVKLIDFRCTEDSNDRGQQICLGTMEYIAPEILSHRREHFDSMSVDIWACGVCLYQMLYGEITDPVEIRPNAALPSFRKIVSKAADIPTHQFKHQRQPIEISEGCRHLVMGLLEKNPERRVTMGEIMRDEWFRTDLPEGALQYNENLIAALEGHTGI